MPIPKEISLLEHQGQLFLVSKPILLGCFASNAIQQMKSIPPYFESTLDRLNSLISNTFASPKPEFLEFTHEQLSELLAKYLVLIPKIEFWENHISTDALIHQTVNDCQREHLITICI